MPTTLTNGIQLPDKGSVDWYNSMQSNYNLIDTHLGNTDTHVTAEDRANWNSKQGSLSQAQLDAIAQVATNTSDIATLQSGKANASHTHSSSDITDIGDYATKQYVDNSISGLVDNAPAALDTLNELSAALNDDSNFASTVTTALSAKANSADLATVATSGSYNDLSNKPSIPTKTSDLTNDSNFVDTSNSAVASGITSAKVTSYDSHVADTDIHVTTADKTKWNTNVTQSYVFRYSGTAVVPNSTIAYSTIDNTDNIKSGDKILDVDGKLFEITAVDTTNQTVTVGTALVDLALDANVVHTSGDETVDGAKVWTGTNTFQQNVTYQRTNFYHQTANPCYILKDTELEKGSLATTHTSYPGLWHDKNGNVLGYVRFVEYSSGRQTAEFKVSNLIKNGALDPTGSEVNCAVDLELQPSGERSLIPEQNDINLGTATNKWKTFNGLTPSSLGMPSDNINSFVDISGYLDTSQSSKNYYTPSVNGWISIKGRSSSGSNGIAIIQGDFAQSSYNLIDFGSSDKVTFCALPVKAGVQVEIWLKSITTLDSAKFFPCQGNI